MWSFGETVFQALTGTNTFTLSELVEYHKGHIVFPRGILRDLRVSETAVDFVASLMASSPSTRLTAEQARTHRWMESTAMRQAGGDLEEYGLVEGGNHVYHVYHGHREETNPFTFLPSFPLLRAC